MFHVHEIHFQEAQAKLLYEKAQRLTIDQEFDQAVETFAEILQLPYLVVSVSIISLLIHYMVFKYIEA